MIAKKRLNVPGAVIVMTLFLVVIEFLSTTVTRSTESTFRNSVIGSLNDCIKTRSINLLP